MTPRLFSGLLIFIPALTSLLLFFAHQDLCARLRRRARFASPYARMCDQQARHNSFHACVWTAVVIWFAWAIISAALYIYD